MSASPVRRNSGRSSCCARYFCGNIKCWQFAGFFHTCMWVCCTAQAGMTSRRWDYRKHPWMDLSVEELQITHLLTKGWFDGDLHRRWWELLLSYSNWGTYWLRCLQLCPMLPILTASLDSQQVRGSWCRCLWCCCSRGHCHCESRPTHWPPLQIVEKRQSIKHLACECRDLVVSQWSAPMSTMDGYDDDESVLQCKEGCQRRKQRRWYIREQVEFDVTETRK